jgi:hypothetical protein
VDVFDARNQLVGEQEHRLERELAVAEVEQVLQAGSKEVENHGVVVALCTKPANERDADAAGERLVDASLILELRVLRLDALQLDGNLLAGDNVGAQVDVAERARTDLTTDPVLVPDAKILFPVSNQSGPNNHRENHATAATPPVVITIARWWPRAGNGSGRGRSQRGCHSNQM